MSDTGDLVHEELQIELGDMFIQIGTNTVKMSTVTESQARMLLSTTDETGWLQRLHIFMVLYTRLKKQPPTWTYEVGRRFFLNKQNGLWSAWVIVLHNTDAPDSDISRTVLAFRTLMLQADQFCKVQGYDDIAKNIDKGGKRGSGEFKGETVEVDLPYADADLFEVVPRRSVRGVEGGLPKDRPPAEFRREVDTGEPGVVNSHPVDYEGSKTWDQIYSNEG